MTEREAEIAQEIRQVAREQLQLSLGRDDEDLAQRLDSMALLSLAVAVEDRFRIALSEEDAASARTLAALAGLVARRAAEEVAPS